MATVLPLNTYSSNFDNGALFAGDEQPVHGYITLAQAAGAQPRGALLGRITATDKYIPAVVGASDGSQLPVTFVVLAYDADATAGDVRVPAYEVGEYAFEKMTVDSSWTFATLDAALRAANSQIHVRSLGVYA